MNQSLSPTPRTYEFRVGTSYRDANGVEWAIIAKNEKELEIAWVSTAPITSKFDPNKLNQVRIIRG